MKPLILISFFISILIHYNCVIAHKEKNLNKKPFCKKSFNKSNNNESTKKGIENSIQANNESSEQSKEQSKNGELNNKKKQNEENTENGNEESSGIESAKNEEINKDEQNDTLTDEEEIDLNGSFKNMEDPALDFGGLFPGNLNGSNIQDILSDETFQSFLNSLGNDKNSGSDGKDNLLGSLFKDVINAVNNKNFNVENGEEKKMQNKNVDKNNSSSAKVDTNVNDDEEEEDNNGSNEEEDETIYKKEEENLFNKKKDVETPLNNVENIKKLNQLRDKLEYTLKNVGVDVEKLKEDIKNNKIFEGNNFLKEDIFKNIFSQLQEYHPHSLNSLKKQNNNSYGLGSQNIKNGFNNSVFGSKFFDDNITKQDISKKKNNNSYVASSNKNGISFKDKLNTMDDVLSNITEGPSEYSDDIKTVSNTSSEGNEHMDEEENSMNEDDDNNSDNSDENEYEAGAEQLIPSASSLNNDGFKLDSLNMEDDNETFDLKLEDKGNTNNNDNSGEENNPIDDGVLFNLDDFKSAFGDLNNNNGENIEKMLNNYFISIEEENKKEKQEDDNIDIDNEEINLDDLKILIEKGEITFEDLTDDLIDKLASPDGSFFELSPYPNDEKDISVNETSGLYNEQLKKYLESYGSYHISYDPKSIDYLKQKKMENKEEEKEDDYYDSYQQIKQSYDGIPSNFSHYAPQLVGDKYVYTSLYDKKKELIKFLKKNYKNKKNANKCNKDAKNNNNSDYHKKLKIIKLIRKYKEDKKKSKNATKSKNTDKGNLLNQKIKNNDNKNRLEIFSKDELDEMVRKFSSKSEKKSNELKQIPFNSKSEKEKNNKSINKNLTNGNNKNYNSKNSINPNNGGAENGYVTYNGKNVITNGKYLKGAKKDKPSESKSNTKNVDISVKYPSPSNKEISYTDLIDNYFYKILSETSNLKALKNKILELPYSKEIKALLLKKYYQHLKKIEKNKNN